MEINNRVLSKTKVNNGEHVFTASIVEHILDSTPIRFRKRTDAYSRKVRHYPLVVRLVSGSTDLEFVFNHSLSVSSLQLETIKADMLIDWDTGIDRVFPEKVEQFNVLMAALEFLELKTLARSFFIRARTFFGKVVSGAASMALLNNLVVVPTMMSIRDALGAREDLYKSAIDKLNALKRPTKFSCKPITRKITTRETVTLITSSSSTGRFECAVDLLTSVKIRKRGTGLLQAVSDPNRFLLSSLTSGYHVDLQFVWDRLPFSFLIDYFAGIGEVLAVDKADLCEFALSGCSEQTVTEVTRTYVNPRIVNVEGNVDLSKVSFSIRDGNVMSFRTFERYAFPTDSQPTVDGIDPVIYQSKGDLSVSQWVNVIAILYSSLVSLVK